MDGWTALMCAASDAADETVAFLLSKGASPDLMESSGQTALSSAIQSSCSSTIALLAPVTRKGLGKALMTIATSQLEITAEVEKLLRRAALDQDALMMGVPKAAQFGATRMLKILTESWTKSTVISVIMPPPHFYRKYAPPFFDGSFLNFLRQEMPG